MRLISTARADGGPFEEVHLGPFKVAAQVSDRGRVRRHCAPMCRLGDKFGFAGDQFRKRTIAEARPEVTQLPQSGGMKGAHLDTFDAQGIQARAHLTGCTRGEGDGECASGVVLAGTHRVRDAMRDRTGLARAGTSKNRHRTMHGLRRGSLLIVKAFEGVHGCDASTPG